MFTFSGINDESGSCIEDSLYASQWNIRYVTEIGIAVIDSAGDETVDERPPGLDREGMVDGAQLP